MAGSVGAIARAFVDISDKAGDARTANNVKIEAMNRSIFPPDVFLELAKCSNEMSVAHLV
jgi:hypothetical protein